jgi:hypothetical protein
MKHYCIDCDGLHAQEAGGCRRARLIHYGRWAAWCEAAGRHPRLTEDLNAVTCWLCKTDAPAAAYTGEPL